MNQNNFSWILLFPFVKFLELLLINFWRDAKNRMLKILCENLVVSLSVKNWTAFPAIQGLLQRDVVSLCWPIAPSYTSPNARGGGALRGLSQWEQLCTSRDMEPTHVNFGDIPPYLTYAAISLGRLLRILTRTVAASWSSVSSASWPPSSWWRRTRRPSRRSSRRPSGSTTRLTRL